MITLIKLCWEFFIIGWLAVGGGLSTIPFLLALSDKYHWYTHQMVTDMIAISQSTPGPMGINMATYVGYTVSGIPGAILASLSLVVPSLILIPLISMALEKFRGNRLVASTFSALRAAVTGLILYAAYLSLATALVIDGKPQYLSIGLVVIILVLSELKPIKKLHPIAFIALGAIIGIVLKL